MEKQILKRILAWVLTFAMVSSMFPVTAFAEEASKSAECIHSHDEFCGYVAAVEEVPCDQACTDTDGDGLIDHAEECAYMPPVEGQPCTHVHDESCGGVIVEQSEKETETEVPTEDTSEREESLLKLIALLNELPDPMAYLADGTAKESILDGDQLAQARAAVDDWFAGEEAASSGSAEEREELSSLMVRLEGLEHIRDTETDCLDVDCPYHYPEIIQEQMAEDETPELLTLDDLVEDYGVEPPMQTFSRLRSASVPHPQTLMLTADNENNSHTGSSDGDIDVLLRNTKGTHPIEVSFTLNELPTQSAYLAAKAYDVDEDSGETDYVYINDDIFLPKDKTNSDNQVYNASTIGYLSGTNATWNTTILRIPLEKLKVGKNTISVTIASGWIVKVDWMQLILDGGAADSNIQEFSLKLENSAASGNNVTVQSSVTVKQTGNVQYTTEYTLTQNATGNALDACFGTVSASETIELALPLNSPSGVYTITGILKESATEAIKATDSISFYFTQDVGLGPRISHTLTPNQLTNQDVTITVSAEGASEAGITDIRIPESPKTVSGNGSYPFTVEYTQDAKKRNITYIVNVDNIDKQAPVITYSTISVLQDETYETVKKMFADALSVSDNVKLAGELLSYTIPQDISRTSGAKTVTVTATDAAGNTTTKDCTITVLAKPVKLTMKTPAPVSGSKDSYTLNAVLDNGSDKITETGFVWGVMPNPTLALNNGSVTTASVVKATGETLTGTATGLLSGVEYYARAYAKVTETGGSTNTVYSDAGKFGLGIPQYGTFTIKNNGNNTFTVTRSGGSEGGTQYVYYRTVNGSAVGGTHFTHQNGELYFLNGETTKTITITEQGANTAYTGNPATAYSNANRTYSVEIYRVTGGGTLGSPKSATRTLTNGIGYTVDRSIYTTEEAKSHNVESGGTYDNSWVADHSGSGDGNLYWRTDRDYNLTHDRDNFNTNSSINGRYSDIDYIKGTAQSYLYRYDMNAHEVEDGWEHAWMGTHEPNNAHSYTKCTGNYTGSPIALDDSAAGSAVWTAVFQIAEGYSATKYFPTMTDGGGEDKGSHSNTVTEFNSNGSVVSVDGTTYAKIPINDTVYNFFAATGANFDKWYVESFTDYTKINDTVEPQLVAVAPMAGGTYLPGDSITVALVFDEIVDGTNSTIGSVSIETNVGTLTYAGGENTNVLYFTGTVASTTNLSGSDALQVTGINNSSYIKDMCSTAGTASTATSGNTNVTVDATIPTVEITDDDAGYVLPRHQATITATNANTLQYAWTQSTDLPAYGWSNVASGTQLTESRGAAGATETWYLHVLATSSSGATTHKSQSFSFMQPNITAVSVRAGASTSDTDVADVWKPSKYIVVTYEGAQTSGTTLTFAGPQSGSQTITSESGTASLQVTKNGTYTVTLKDSYGSVISKTIEVTKIDAAAPTVTLRSGNSTEAGTVYNSLSIAVLPADTGGSGLAKVEYAWTNTTAELSTWNTLAASDGSYQATYTATETTKTPKYLQVRVTDGAGNVSSVVTSGPYQVIQAATGTALPSITVTGNPTAWTNSATLTWTATKGTGTDAGDIQTVYTPDGFVTGSATGTCTVTKNGIYSFVVIDANGNSASAEVNVTNVDSEAPKLTSLTAQADHTNGTITLEDVTDNCTVIYDDNGNYSSISGSGLKTRQYKLESESTWTTFTDDSITVAKNGTYIIKLTDQVGNSREYSVKMEGIQYTVTFNANGHGTAPDSQTVNYGDKATQPAALTATGYVFGGWYTDAACTEGNQFDFANTQVQANTTLYAKWTLAEPSVTLTADGGTTDTNSGVVNAVYNHGATVVTLKAELSNPVSGIQYTYAWYKGTEKLNLTGESLPLKTVNQSGTYKVEVTAHGAGQTATKASGEITVRIAKATPVVTVTPTASAITYGDSLADSFFTGGEAKVEGTPVAECFAWAAPGSTPAVSDSNATPYTVVFTPEDTANYNSITTACTLTVHKKDLTPSVASVADKIYDQTVTASGTVFLTGAVLGQQPEATGTFAFTNANAGQNKQVDVTGIALTGNWGANYTLSTTSLTNQNTTANITPKTVGLTWNGDTGLVYSGNPVNVTANATGVLEGDVCEVTVTSGTETNAGTHTAVPSLSNQNYCLPEGATHSYTIEKAPITFQVSNNTATYDGTGKSATVEQTAGQTPRIGAEGYQVSYAQNGVAAATATDAGTYNVIVTLTDGNYQHAGQGDSDQKTVGKLTVDPKPITAAWTNLTAEYNGTAQAPVCTTLVGLMEADAGQDDAGRKYVSADFTAEQRLTNAGTKRLTAVLGGERADNYRLTNPHVNFTVQKAPVTFAVADNVVQADGHAHKATVSAYANGAALDASNYAITYRNAAGQTVQEPVDAGTYGIYAELKNPNYRHSGTAETAARQIGVLTIYRNQTAKTYTVEFAKGASEVTGALPTSQTGVSEGTLIYMPEKGNLARTGYAFTGWLLNGKLYQPGETFTMPANNVTITACWKEATYHISGVVDQKGKPLPHAVVTLKRGSEIIGETTTDAQGKYSFESVMPGLYNLVTSYDGITTTVKVLIEDTDAVANATLPAGRTNSILDVVAGAPAVIVGNLEKLFQTAEDSPVYSENDKSVVNSGGTVEIRLTVEKVAEPDPTGAELLKEAMQELPAAFNYQPELYLDLVLQKTVYPVGSNSPDTKILSDSQVVLESVISLPANLQGRNFYKVYRVHINEQGIHELHELPEWTPEQPDVEEYYKLNPDKTEMTIYARKYSVYTVAASDYVAPQPAKPESSGGVEGQPDNSSPEEETKVENSQVNQKPLQAAQKLPVKRDLETEKTEESPEAIPTENPEEIPTEIPQAPLPEQERWEEPMPAGRNGKSFVVLNVLLTLLSLVMAVRLLRGRQERRRKIAGLTAAAASFLILLLTLGFAGVRIADLRTILFALLAAITVFMNLTGTKQDKEERVL